MIQNNMYKNNNNYYSHNLENAKYTRADSHRIKANLHQYGHKNTL